MSEGSGRAGVARLGVLIRLAALRGLTRPYATSQVAPEASRAARSPGPWLSEAAIS